MKYTKIALACGLAFAATAAQSASVPVPANTTTIFVSGASAVDNFFADTVNTMMTNVTAVRAADDGDHRAYLGTANGVSGVADGTSILLIKRSDGGSVFGVNPVARAEKITTIDLDNCTAITPTAADPYSFECGTKGDDNAGAAGLAPDFGLSDVEPNMFQGFNLKAGGVALSAAELSALVSQPVNQQGMGIVATDAVADTTHISRAAYGAMLAGKLASWEQLDGSSDPAIVCRRTNGSGTQASYNWFFSGFPCNTATNGFVANTPATSLSGNIVSGSGTAQDPLVVEPTTAKVTIVENGGSSGVRACLEAANSQTDYTTEETSGLTVTYKFSSLANPGKAVGVLSMDSYVKLVGKGASYRYLDGAGVFDMAAQTGTGSQTGIAPSKDNIVNGRYDFVLELSANQRAAGNDATKVAFWNELVKNLGSTTYTGDTTGSFTTVPNAFATLPTSASYDAQPTKVSKYTRGANTCQAMSWQPSL